MQIQYKLYKIDKKNMSDVIEKIANRYTYICIKDSIVAIQYDYSANGYKELLEFMANLDASQYIVTTSKFYNILTKMVKQNLRVYEIKLNALFEEDNEHILRYISRMNVDKVAKEDILHELLEELRWYNYDEGIDIAHMSFGLKNKAYFSRFYIYNNGVVAVDEDSYAVDIFELLKEQM